MFLLTKNIYFFIFIYICCNIVTCSRLRESNKDDSIEGIFHSERSSSSSVTSKKARVPTKWPLMDTWITENIRQSGSSSSTKSESTHSPLAENIKCSTRGNSQSFTAVISQPFGFGNVPLFEDASSSLNPVTSEDCQMKPSGGSFIMKINDFNKCGVKTEKGSDGKEWLAVSIVFPYVGGLRTSDDEHVMIMCKPQDRIATKSHVIDYRPNM